MEEGLKLKGGKLEIFINNDGAIEIPKEWEQSAQELCRHIEEDSQEYAAISNSEISIVLDEYLDDVISATLNGDEAGVIHATDMVKHYVDLLVSSRSVEVVSNGEPISLQLDDNGGIF